MIFWWLTDWLVGTLGNRLEELIAESKGLEYDFSWLYLQWGGFCSFEVHYHGKRVLSSMGTISYWTMTSGWKETIEYFEQLGEHLFIHNKQHVSETYFYTWVFSSMLEICVFNRPRYGFQRTGCAVLAPSRGVHCCKKSIARHAQGEWNYLIGSSLSLSNCILIESDME